MILDDQPIFNEPLIKISTKKVSNKNVGEKNVLFKEPEVENEITLEKLETIKPENLESVNQDLEPLDLSNNIAKDLEKVENLSTDLSNNSVESDNISLSKEVDSVNDKISQFTKEVNEVNLDDLEKKAEPLETKKDSNELQEVNLTFDEEDKITLKNPNEIYLDIYRQAREKAKKAKQEAIKAYLEAKRIKELYMLEIVDSSEDESDSEEDSGEENEDELFSEN